jgi:hypothetical protein
MDARLAAISRLAQTSPELVQEAIADLRASMFAVADRFDASSAMIAQALQIQLDSLSRTAHDERVAISQTFDEQRRAITSDARRVASEVTEATWQHVRGLARELAVYWLLTLLLALGLPFVAGYLVGHARAVRRA